ncbi:alpha/beta hydrolase [Streptomyces sp. NPDC127038]|uniref:alpha/beta hydrolase n=1 Tax=Streptomyces sp. NPDC127038 TaxID=3347114 RepID=UPI00365FB4EA
MRMEMEIGALAERGIFALEQRGQQGAPSVVLLHGINADHTEDRSSTKPGLFDLLVESLAAQGIGTVRFDFRGHGHSKAVDGHVSIESEFEDLDVVMSWLVDNGRRPQSVVACSFGACATGLYLERKSTQFECVVLVNPVLKPLETFLEPGSPWARENFNEASLRQLDETGTLMLDGELPLGVNFVRDVKTVQPQRGLSEYRGPLSIVHGNADTYVPFEYSADFARRQQASMLVVTGSEHGFGVMKDREFVAAHVSSYVAWALR